MRKLLIYLVTFLFVFFLSACGEEKEDKEVNEKKETTEQVENEKENVIEEKEVDKENENDIEIPSIQETEDTTNYLEYRPKIGSKKSFTENGELVFTEEIIAVNDEYVQLLLQLGDNKTTQIYRWTKDEITLIYEDYNLVNGNEDMLDAFEPIEQHETILSNDPKVEPAWNLMKAGDKVNVPTGEFKNVLMVQKKTEEVVNEETTYTRYYAPGIGLIKEEYSVSGENGYTTFSELSSVE